MEIEASDMFFPGRYGPYMPCIANGQFDYFSVIKPLLKKVVRLLICKKETIIVVGVMDIIIMIM